MWMGEHFCWRTPAVIILALWRILIVWRPSWYHHLIQKHQVETEQYLIIVTMITTFIYDAFFKNIKSALQPNKDNQWNSNHKSNEIVLETNITNYSEAIRYDLVLRRDLGEEKNFPVIPGHAFTAEGPGQQRPVTDKPQIKSSGWIWFFSIMNSKKKCISYDACWFDPI